MLEYREISKLKGTYVDALPALADAEGRVHSSFRQTVAATGRLSSSDPNLQNIPIRTAAGREIRRAFIAPPGRKLVVADYSQIELRILAHISGDENLIEAFERGAGHPPRDRREDLRRLAGPVSHEMRFAAKRINFALLYGMAAFTLGKELGVSTSEAKSYVDSYFAQFPKVRGVPRRHPRGGAGDARGPTLFGRVRPIPDIAASNPNVRGNAERMALNAPFQGSAADIIKIAMIRLDRGARSAGARSRGCPPGARRARARSARRGGRNASRALVGEVMEGAAQLKVRLARRRGLRAATGSPQSSQSANRASGYTSRNSIVTAGDLFRPLAIATGF